MFADQKIFADLTLNRARQMGGLSQKCPERSLKQQMQVDHFHALFVVSRICEPPLKTCLFIKPAQPPLLEVSTEQRRKQRILPNRTAKMRVGLVLKHLHVVLYCVRRTAPLFADAIWVLSHPFPLALGLGDMSVGGMKATVFRVSHFHHFLA